MVFLIIIVAITCLIAVIAFMLDEKSREQKRDVSWILSIFLEDYNEVQVLNKYSRYYWKFINEDAFGTYFTEFKDFLDNLRSYYQRIKESGELYYHKRRIRDKINTKSHIGISIYGVLALTVVFSLISAIYSKIDPSKVVFMNMDGTSLFIVILVIYLVITLGLLAKRIYDERKTISERNFLMLCYDIIEDIESDYIIS